MSRTAFLVIHGIGNQNPYETLDSFTQGLDDALAGSAASPFSWEHHQVARGAGHQGWMQQFLRAAPDGGFHAKSDPAHHIGTIDVYEYYWAHQMSGQADMADILAFLDNASRNAREFYKDRADAKARIAMTGAASKLLGRGKQPEFNDKGYIRLLARWWPIIAFLWKASRWFSWLPTLHNWLRRASDLIGGKIIPVLGDVAVYVQMDKKAMDFSVRQTIIADAAAAICALAEDENYDRVIVAGHSLGSVIAYDALGRLNKNGQLGQGAAAKLRLVTFGSPLDKIYFFFRKHDERLGLTGDKGGAKPILRSQIIRNQHGLRRQEDRSLAPLGEELPLEDRTAAHLSDLQWINIYNQYDPVSGYLDAFQTGNIRLEIAKTNPVSAHLDYWNNDEFYAPVLDYFLFGTKRLKPDNHL